MCGFVIPIKLVKKFWLMTHSEAFQCHGALKFEKSSHELSSNSKLTFGKCILKKCKNTK